MTTTRYRAAIVATTAFALVASASTAAMAQNASRPIAKNETIFIDGKALTITNGMAKDDVGAQIARLHARDIGPGAIIFRANDKLYVVDEPPLPLYALNDDRQRSYGGLNDDRPGSPGVMYDPDYLNYRLKKTFEDMTGSGATALPPAPVPSAPADKK